MTNDIELNDEFIAGLNNDLRNLLRKRKEQELLNLKLNRAEFVLGGCNGTCSLCFKELKHEQIIMISEALNLANAKYRVLYCMDCAKEQIQDLMNGDM